MKNKEINKKKILLVILFLIIFIIAICLLIRFLYTTDDVYISKNKLTYINSTEWNNEAYPKGMPAFVRAYSGKQTAQNIGKSIDYVVTELIPKYNKELKGKTDENLKEFFEENRELILLNFGIKNERDFKNLMNEILKLESENFNIELFYIDELSIKSSNTNTKATLHVKYKDCEEISINIKALNTIQKEASSVIYY